MTDQTIDVKFVRDIVVSLVDNPEEVEVNRNIDEMGVLITLKVAKSDMGKIIGKRGKIVGAIRILLGALGMKIRARLNLKIYEPEEYKNNQIGDPTDVSSLV